MGHTESCLYVCLASQSDTRWYTLCRKPCQTLTNDTKKSSEYVLAKVPIPHSPHAYFSSLVAVGSDIYNIGSRSSVSVMDCRFHTWHEAPSMSLELISYSASVVDGKIYVAGRHGDFLTMKNSCEVLDTKTQIWDHLPPVPCDKRKCCFYYLRSACIDGKFHVKTNTEVFGYNSNECRWHLADPMMDHVMMLDSYCEIENVLYSARNGVFMWLDTEVSELKYLKGLVGLRKIPPSASVRLADYGGKMAVLWEEDLPSSGQKMIWCAEIALKRLKSCDIWGKVEWFDHVRHDHGYG